MTCTMCALTIERHLLGQRGVATASVNFARGQATITYDADTVAPKQLVQAIGDVGYDADTERAELEVVVASRLAASWLAFSSLKDDDDDWSELRLGASLQFNQHPDSSAGIETS